MRFVASADKQCYSRLSFSLKDLPLNKALTLPPLLHGMWQVSGSHGAIDHERAITAMVDYHRAGFKAWDLADHYGPAEDLVAEYCKRVRNELGQAEASSILLCTKWVPTNLETRWTLDVKYDLPFVEKNIDISLRRMNVEQLDLLQFHWWDYEDSRLFECLDHLFTLKKKGKIKEVGLTNFSGSMLKKILDLGYPIFSNQVRFSLIDQRPKKELANLCQQANVKLLAFGTVGGGFLSSNWLGQPNPEGREDLNRGQFVQSKLIKNAGGWDTFQQLLKTITHISEEHGVSASNVASKFMLQQPGVSAIIVGVRLGIKNYIGEDLKTMDLDLSAEDCAKIDNALREFSDLGKVLGEVACEYRGANL